MKYLLLPVCGFLLFFTGWSQPTAVHKGPEGKWRGVFKLKDGVEIPFNFGIVSNTTGAPTAYLLNAEEKFEAGAVRITADSVFISLNQFDNELAFSFKGDEMTGVFRRQDKTGPEVPVAASRNAAYRFKETGIVPDRDFSGRYSVEFRTEKGVGIFTQKGNHLRAVFLKTTGDSRYLEGIVEGNHFYLSSFIGANPSYYYGTIDADGKMTATFTTPRSSQEFSGKFDERAALPDAYSITNLKDGYSTFDFCFPDVHGKKISPHDPRYRNKVLVVTIGGTWCQNCMDEAAFLAPWYKKNKNRGVDVIAIHYERQMDTVYIKKVLTRFRQRFGITYDAVLGGAMPDLAQVAATLPSLKTFVGFPTTLFIDRKGQVARIHTGFSGPATGKYYTDFVKEFNDEIDLLLQH